MKILVYELKTVNKKKKCLEILSILNEKFVFTYKIYFIEIQQCGKFFNVNFEVNMNLLSSRTICLVNKFLLILLTI